MFVNDYTYLGIVLHRNGSFTSTVDTLRKKALRAMFGLRRYIDKSQLSVRALLNLFDFLIKPVLSYGAPIWTPSSPTIKKLLNYFEYKDVQDSTSLLTSLAKSFAQNPLESIHLKHLKWMMNTHKYTSNIATWGDLGRIPLVIDQIKQTICYRDRLENMDDTKITKLAFLEQKDLDLPWYSFCNKLCNIASHVPDTDINVILNRPHLAVKKCLTDVFKSSWELCLHSQSKLDTYKTLKDEFGLEDYTAQVKDMKCRSVIFKLRARSHNLEVEKGKYKDSNIPRSERFCSFCSENGLQLVEDEAHFLLNCSFNSDIRKELMTLLGNSVIALPVERPDSVKHLIHKIYTKVPKGEARRQQMDRNRAAKLIYKMYTRREDHLKQTVTKSDKNKFNTVNNFYLSMVKCSQ